MKHRTMALVAVTLLLSMSLPQIGSAQNLASGPPSVGGATFGQCMSEWISVIELGGFISGGATTGGVPIGPGAQFVVFIIKLIGDIPPGADPIPPFTCSLG